MIRWFEIRKKKHFRIINRSNGFWTVLIMFNVIREIYEAHLRSLLVVIIKCLSEYDIHV